MTATLEFNPSATEVQGVLVAELPNSLEAAQNILAKAEPLRSDAAYQALFYDQMGVQRSQLTELDPLEGARVLAVPELEQDSGSFKRRGATHAVLQSTATTLSSYSTGNHASSLVEAVEAVNRLGGHKELELEVPRSISPAKLCRLEGRADLRFHDQFGDAQAAATARRYEADVEVIDPFGHEAVVAGQCSAGLELVQELIEQGVTEATIAVPTAGGGYLCGIALPIWQAKQAGLLSENIRVVAVQPENTDALGRAVAKVQVGEDPQRLFAPDELDTDCDALAIDETSLSPLTLAIASDPRFVQGFATVNKVDLAVARQQTSQQLGVEVEPAAALGMAYARQHAAPGKTFVLPVTGKNVSDETRRLYDQLVPREAPAATPDNSANAAAFKRLSDAYANRKVFGLAEIVQNPQDTAELPGIWAGATALKRVGLVVPSRLA